MSRKRTTRGFAGIRQLWKLRSDARSNSTDRAELETLVPCAACDGSGAFVLDDSSHNHRSVACPWCGGMGHTDSFMIASYRDWERDHT